MARALTDSAMSISIALLSILASCLPTYAQDVEELYAIDGFDPNGLVRLDQQAGAVRDVHRTPLPGGYLWHGLMFDGSRLVAPAIRGGYHPSYITHLGPSSGYQGAPLLDAGSFGNMSIDMDPTTRRIWGVGQVPDGGSSHLWEFDAVTGVATSHGPIIGPQFVVLGITFDRLGTCYVTADLGPIVWTLDLSSGTASPIANLHLGNGFFHDITFSQRGEIWGSFYSASALAQPSGIYKFDLATFTPTLVRQTVSPQGIVYAYLGIAFARFPAPVPICPGKPNSQGCTPGIEVEGFPSASGNKGFWVRARDVVNRQPGLLLLSVNGAGSTPFGGGTLCVSPPVYASSIRNSGGSVAGRDCSGIWQLDLEPEIRHREQAGLGPALPPGQTIYLQWFGRDPYLVGSDPIGLSGAVAVTLMP